MNRQRIDSSFAREIGHDSTGMEVQFHAPTCGTASVRSLSGAGPEKACDCEGGNVYHFPLVTAQEHAELMAAESIGKHFAKHIRPHHKGVKSV